MIFHLRLSKFAMAALLVTLAGCASTGNAPTDPALPDEPQAPIPADCSAGRDTLPSLTVAAGETCSLIGTTIQGDLTLASGARLVDTIGIEVEGNITGQGAAEVNLEGVTVGGNLQLEGGNTVDIANGTVAGNVQLTGNRDGVSVADTAVEGDLQILQNTGDVFVSTNIVTGNLQCEGNDPAPTGEENIVTGSKEGQCSGL